MKNFNILIASMALLFMTGCVKPVQNTQPIYTDSTQPVAYEEAQPIIYEGSGNTVTDGTIVTGAEIGQPISYPDPYATTGGVTTTTTTYPDPYATTGGTSYPNPYGTQPTISEYPATTASGQGGGIHLQIAALKDYYTAEDYKNRLSLAPGLSAYVQRGAMNKVIVTGIPSVAEANRLKETRFPGAFIVQGGSSIGTGSTGINYTQNNPYGTPSSSAMGNSGIGVQIGAFGSQGKAQSVANSQSGQYPAVVRKIGRYYKVILTGFSSRSAAKAHASRVGGFVVSSY